MFMTLPTISSRIRRTRAEPFGVMQTITLRRSSRAAERITYRRFSRRATRPLAAAVVCPIFFAISDMLSTSLRSRYARRKYCGNETLPGASSLDRYSRKQRCISKMMWERRSASPRVSFAGISANAVTCPVFKAIKLGTPAPTVNAGQEKELREQLINPRFEHQQFHLISTTDQARREAIHLPDSTQTAHAIPDDRPA